MASVSPTLHQLSPKLSFVQLEPATQQHGGRLGRLGYIDRPPIYTPHYIGVSSRGCIPHLTPDITRSETAIKGIYTAFEDYAEYLPEPPPVYDFPCSPTESPLRRFLTLHQDVLIILGPRRVPALSSAAPNTPTSMNVCTSKGFRGLEITQYIEAAARMRPDVMIAPVDVDHGRPPPGRRRIETMGERSVAWVRALQREMNRTRQEANTASAIWVPILPIEAEMQKSYLEHLEEGGDSAFDGVVLYGDSSVLDIPDNMQDLLRVSLSQPRSPQQILSSISSGIDLFAIPFISLASEAGIAFTFAFPAPSLEDKRLPLGIDMWTPSHASSLLPLQEGCTCYTCKNHHRAYIQHLLSAKEMLAWVLLQLHNHHVVDEFFTGVRESIAAKRFEDLVEGFTQAYEEEFPEFKGQGPRLRGYQSGRSPKPKKLNKAPFRKLEQNSLAAKPQFKGDYLLNDRRNRQAESSEEAVLGQDVDAGDLEDIGFARLYERDD